jgi:CheY-like chemotaxis protein
MLSARSEEADKVRGLETGADDYVVKPYSVAELLARLRTQLRRTARPRWASGLEFEDIVVDLAEHRVYRDGMSLNLGPTEFRLLTAFMERPGRVWSREQLLDRVWGRDIYVDSRTVDVHVGRLRKALNAARCGRSDPDRAGRGLRAWLNRSVREWPPRLTPAFGSTSVSAGSPQRSSRRCARFSTDRERPSPGSAKRWMRATFFST